MKLDRALTKEEKDDIAAMLKISPEAYTEFEDAYQSHILNFPDEGLFGAPIKKVKNVHKHTGQEVTIGDLIKRIVEELKEDALQLSDGNNGQYVTKEEIEAVPVEQMPQLSRNFMKVDIKEPSSNLLLYMLERALKNDKNSMEAYGMFRAGLDSLDLDEISYEMLGKNPTSMGYWFPELEKAVSKQSYFKVPKTKIVKVPLPILQMTRLEYGELTQSTLDIVNRWAYDVFNLDESKTYFVKTGIFSSKFDFRNAKVSGAEEVRTLGEYLLYITHQASLMSSLLRTPHYYGANTTNEWVVREFIEDLENNPCIYKGMPLHTEYRVFVDFDTKELLGISPYWRPDVMKERFSGQSDRNEPDMIHDYIVYSSHEETLMKRYYENKDSVVEHMKALILNMNLHGQWSVDVMQNSADMWIIDMAPAEHSALSDVVPKGKLKHNTNEARIFLPVKE